MYFYLRPWPLIGSLHLLGRFKRVPFEAFTALQKVKIPSYLAHCNSKLWTEVHINMFFLQEYGQVVQLRMGSLNAVVVSEGPDVREVLHTKVSFRQKIDFHSTH